MVPFTKRGGTGLNGEKQRSEKNKVDEFHFVSVDIHMKQPMEIVCMALEPMRKIWAGDKEMVMTSIYKKITFIQNNAYEKRG